MGIRGSTNTRCARQSSPKSVDDTVHQQEDHGSGGFESHNSPEARPEALNGDLITPSPSFNSPVNEFEARASAPRSAKLSYPAENTLPIHTEHTSPGRSLHHKDTQSSPAEQAVNSASTRDYYLDGTRDVVHYDISSRSDTTPQSFTGIYMVNHSDQRSNSFANVWSYLPKHLPATCPLDQILLDFLASRRLMSTCGTTIESVLGPKELSVIGIISPTLTQTLHPVSRVMAEIFSTFPNVAVTEKIGFMYKMHRTLRWQIAPTEENYLELPTWLRPTATQLTVPHAAWIDNIPWPSVRDLLIQKSDVYPFEIFSEFYSQEVSVRWPYDPLDAIIHHHPHGKEDAVLNPIFEKHVRKLSNWTVSAQFERQMPELFAAVCHD